MLKLHYLIISLVLLLFAGCSSAISVDDGVIRDEQGDSIIDNTTNAVIVEDILFKIASKEIDGYHAVHKFGAGELTSIMKPISQGGFYRVPTTPTSLEFVSDDVDDTYLGAGARQITITGLDSSWEEVTFTINTSGTTAVALPIDLLRVYRWYVSSSGTYATQTVASHQGELELREVGGGQTWSIIPNSPFPVGQSEIGVYTIPKGKTGYLLSKFMFTDTTKTADIFFYGRCFADDVTTPYSGTMRLVEREIGLTEGQSITYQIPKGPFVGPCDIGFMGRVSSGTVDVSVEFELIVIDDN